MSKITVFIDESGTLPDPKDRAVVVAAVGTTTPAETESIIKEVRKKGKYKKKTGELKFYTASEKAKTTFFEKLVKRKFDIFILIVEKMGRKIPDTPQHFAILCWLLLTDVFNFYPQVKEIVFDRHFHRNKDTEEFDKFLNKFLGELPVINHVDSEKDKKVNIADMVAGAVLAKEVGKEKKFYQMFKGKIISEARINWPEAKRKIFKQKLA